MPVELRCLTAEHAPTNQSGYALFIIAVGEVELLEDDTPVAPNGR